MGVSIKCYGSPEIIFDRGEVTMPCPIVTFRCQANYDIDRMLLREQICFIADDLVFEKLKDSGFDYIINR